MDTNQRIAAVRKHLRAIQIQERQAEDAGPPCSACIFGPIDGSGFGNCDHIAHWARRHDPVTGKWRGKNVVTTAEARSAEGLCGPEGLLFQPYTVKGKVARWLNKRDLYWLVMGPLIGIGLAAALIGGS